MTTPRRREAGFTMIEVMVAILLTAIAVIGVVGLFRVETRASGFSRHATEAAVLAQDKLEQLRTLAAPTASVPVLSETLNELGVAVTGGRYTREWVVNLNVDVYDIVVTVSWDEDGATRQVVVRGQRGSK